MTQIPQNTASAPASDSLDPLVPGALLDDEVLEDLRRAERLEAQRLEGRLTRHDVTAVLVSHNGARWLPYVLTALADLTLAPQRVVAVDTGSTDASRRLLADSLTEAGLIDAGPSTPFGAAVGEAVLAYAGAPGLPSPEVDAPRVGWVWVLHDDCAPEADALRHLLLVAERNPRAGVIGPKVRGWHEGRRLLELGVSVGRGGRRETWLERDETDQGQHDHRREVLAAGSAGMLVRRDVWDELGGFDPAFPMFREDVDLCWRAWRAGHEVVVAPDAVVHHVEAAARGRRHGEASFAERPHRADRRSALLLLLGNLPGRLLPWTYLRLFLGSLLRALGLVLAKAPGEGLDELVAMAAVLARPDRVVRVRSRRRGLRARPWAEIRPLLAPTGLHVRQGVEAAFGLLSLGGTAGSGSALETGPSADGEELVEAGSGPSALRRLFSRTGTWLALGLLAVTLAAERRLLTGGALQGGALLPSPARAAELWTRYEQAWHEVGVGSSTAAPPYLAVLVAPSWLVFGHVGFTVSVLLLLAVPLAGLSGYVLAKRLTQRRLVAVWAAATYALLPPLTAAVAAGRLGTAVLGWLLPLLVLSVLAALRGGSRWPRTWAAVLLLTVGAAFVPLLWVASLLIAVAVLLVGAMRRGVRSLWRGRAATSRLLVLVLVPPLLLLPWSATLAAHPTRLFLEAGAPSPGTVDPTLPAWALDLVQPGGPVAGPRWLFAALVLAALASLLRPDRRRPVVLAWGVALVGLGLAVAALVVRAHDADGAATVIPWPGGATLILGGGLVAAAVVGGDGLRERLAARTFGWRQPLTVLLALAAVLTTLAAGVAWVSRGAGDPLTRGPAELLPPYVSATNAGPRHPTALVLEAGADGQVAYFLERAEGPRLADAELAPSAGAAGGLDELVSSLAAGVENNDSSQRLLRYGVASIVVLRPMPATVVTALDETPGLERLASTHHAAVWRVAGQAGRALLVTPGAPASSLLLSTSTPEGLTASVPDGPAGRSVVLVEAADPHWRATLDGVALRPVDAGWAQGFALPEGGGSLVVGYDASSRNRALVLQGLGVLVVLVLALPARRRREEPDDDLPPEPLHAARPTGVAP
ncbi:MAG TPA: glycosyltransferase family 2 protein [Actinomycetes bacterium]|nr:glycosyltransferase family 2 protein [Actinomycetes bacterium]